MKILILSQYFYPENFKVNDIAFDFAKKGHEVTVLTGIPNYPTGIFFKGYGFFKKKKEKLNGVNIIRTNIFPRLNGSGKFLVLNYLSFIFFSFFTVNFRVKRNYDIVFSHLPSPLTSAIPGIWLKKKCNAKLFLWVLDLWPESVKANTNIKNPFVYKMLHKIINYIYKNADEILVSSNSFKISIHKEFDVPKHKLKFFPNWAEDVFTKKNSNFKSIFLPEGFNIMFAGNLGDSQDFESILKAAKITQGININWVIVGDGRKSDWIKKEVEKEKLKNVYLLGRHPLQDMPSFFSKANAMLVSLKNEPTFDLTIPAKVQAYMASKKVILGMLNGEGHKLINNTKSGFAASAGDYSTLAKNAIKASNLSFQEIEKIEENSYSYYVENFSKDNLFNKLEDWFTNI